MDGDNELRSDTSMQSHQSDQSYVKQQLDTIYQLMASIIVHLFMLLRVYWWVTVVYVSEVLGTGIGELGGRPFTQHLAKQSQHLALDTLTVLLP